MDKPLISVDNLTYGYEDDPVIKDISIEVKPGEILLIEGENGAGKTTLLKCITGILNNGRRVFLEGKEIVTNKNLLKNISFVMSDDFLYDYLTVKENIYFFKKMYDEGREYENNIEFFINQFNIEKYENYLVKNLSQGTRNKVYIAILLSRKHKILVLDEPFTALDANTQNIILGFVEKYKYKDNKAVIMVTHIAQFKQIATRKYLMTIRGE